MTPKRRREKDGAMISRLANPVTAHWHQLAKLQLKASLPGLYSESQAKRCFKSTWVLEAWSKCRRKVKATAPANGLRAIRWVQLKKRQSKTTDILRVEFSRCR